MTAIELGRQIIDQKHAILTTGGRKQASLGQLHRANHQLLLASRQHLVRAQAAHSHPQIRPVRSSLGKTSLAIALELVVEHLVQLTPLVPAPQIAEFETFDIDQLSQRARNTGRKASK